MQYNSEIVYMSLSEKDNFLLLKFVIFIDTIT